MNVFAGIDFSFFFNFHISCCTLELFLSRVSLNCEREWGSRHNEFVYLKRFLPRHLPFHRLFCYFTLLSGFLLFITELTSVSVVWIPFAFSDTLRNLHGAVLHLNEVPSISTFQLFTVKIFVEESQKFAPSTHRRPDFFFLINADSPST